MAAVPAHVKVARSKGTQAGFDAFYERMNEVTQGGTNGLPAVRQVLAEVNRAGKLKKDGTFRYPEKALAYYCNKYGLTDLPKTKRAPRKSTATQATPATTTPAALVLTPEQVEALAALGFVQADTPMNDEDDEDEIEAVTPATQRTGNVRNVRRQTDETREAAAAVYPEPRDRDADATQGKLWKLNSQGPENGIYLCVINDDGDILAGGSDPITAGEAYDLIGEYIAS